MTTPEAYRNYMRVVYFAALQGDFDFEADYGAYVAMAEGNSNALIVAATMRRRKLGVKPSQVKFHKKENSLKSWKSAVKTYDEAKREHCANLTVQKAIVKAAPMHLTHTTGEQGPKGKEGTLVAHYSHKRPRKVRSAFGDADNRPIFE